ncbi:MAG: oligoribonuclease [Bifidobacterium pseudocatenulatum]
MNEEAAKPDALLWLDFETTGIDRASSLPLEVGMECTDVLGEQSFGSLTRIIRPASLDLLDMSPVAFSMHTDNGLLFELLNSSFRNDSIGAVANAVEEYLDSLSQRFTLIPAGTNVDFDMAFLVRLNLRPSAWLSYRKFDLTALRRYLTFLQCPEDLYKDRQSPHRVRDCIQRDINDYRMYRELLKGKW